MVATSHSVPTWAIPDSQFCNPGQSYLFHRIVSSLTCFSLVATRDFNIVLAHDGRLSCVIFDQREIDAFLIVVMQTFFMMLLLHDSFVLHA